MITCWSILLLQCIMLLYWLQCIILSSVIRFSIDMVHDYGNSSRKKDCSKIKWSRELLLIFLTISLCNNIVQYIVQANKYSQWQKKEQYMLKAVLSLPLYCHQYIISLQNDNFSHHAFHFNMQIAILLIILFWSSLFSLMNSRNRVPCLC